MVGTREVSRTLADRQLVDEVLEQGIQTALARLATIRADAPPAPASCPAPWDGFRMANQVCALSELCALGSPGHYSFHPAPAVNFELEVAP